MGRRVLGWAGDLLVTAGVLLLLFAVWQLWWTDVVADRAAAQVVEQLREDFARDPGLEASGGQVAPSDLPGGAVALLHVPRFGEDWVRPVLEGTDADVLATGVGHYTGTAAPGEVGNFAVAGHRTTWGRPFHDIDRLRAGDRVLVETADAVHVYAVTGHEVVQPADVRVIAPVPDEPGAAPVEPVLTLTSCHPRYSAEQRYVVHAELAETLDPADLATALAAPAAAAGATEG